MPRASFRARLVLAFVLASFSAVIGLGGALPFGAAAVAQDGCPTDWPTDTLQIMAPAAPGGGWDTTAREVQRVLTEEQVVGQSVEVFNVEGSGGTIGLAQLATEHSGNENMLMMMGLVMIGGIQLNQSPVTLDQITPVARLTTEFEVIVVPADSPFQTLDDLIAAFTADPGSISWGGGSAGGTDNILVGLIAQAAGVDPTSINYVPFSGGGEALAAILGGQVSAGVSGVSEWQAQIESGELRALAVSGRAQATPAGGTPGASPAASPPASPAAGSGGMTDSIPTLQEQGVDVELANWRGLMAPAEVSDDARACMVNAIGAMVQTEGWQEALATNGWTDFYLPGDEYGAYLGEETTRVNTILSELGLIES